MATLHQRRCVHALLSRENLALAEVEKFLSEDATLEDLELSYEDLQKARIMCVHDALMDAIVSGEPLAVRAAIYIQLGIVRPEEVPVTRAEQETLIASAQSVWDEHSGKGLESAGFDGIRWILKEAHAHSQPAPA